MCRLALYDGPPAPLAATLYDPPRSLQVLAYQPRELLHGTVNVDGTGVAWWPEGGRAEPPLRYVTPSPPWSDPNLPDLARRLTAVTSLAAVRGATPGIPYGAGAVAPFVRGRLAFAHNGWIGGFRGALGRELVAELADDRFADLTVASDSLALFLTITQAADTGSDLGTALRTSLGRVAKIVLAADQQATLNVALSDGTTSFVTRTSVGERCNSLYVHQAPDAVVVASEPLDEGDWQPVPEHHLVRVTAGTAALEPLDLTA